MTVVAGNLGNIPGILLAGHVWGLEADHVSVGPLPFNGMKRRVGGFELRMLVRGPGRQIGTLGMAFVTELIFRIDLCNKITDPPARYPAEGNSRFDQMRIMTVDTLGMSRDANALLGKRFILTMNATDAENGMRIRLAQFRFNVRQDKIISLAHITPPNHLVSTGCDPMTGKTDGLLTGDLHGHSSMASPAGLRQDGNVGMSPLKNSAVWPYRNGAFTEGKSAENQRHKYP
jgi:hypothetical protein